MDLSKDDKDYIRHYVAQGENDAVKKDRRKECASVFQLTLSQVAAITAHSTGKLAQRLTSRPVVKLLNPTLFPELSFPEMPPGVAMDYDNPIKRKYRTKLLGKGGFVDRNASEDREDHNVLIFPGRKCLEVPMWLELGYTPHKIVGCEIDPSAFPEFCYNAAKWGISVRTTDVANIVDEMEWDAVHLDYCGPVGKEMLEHLQNIRMAKKSIFAINLMGQREGEFAQLIIDHYWTGLQKLKEVKRERDFIKVLHMDKTIKEEMYRNAVDKIMNFPDVELKDKRDEAIPYGINFNLSRNMRHLYRTHEIAPLPKYVHENRTRALCIEFFHKKLWRVLCSCGHSESSCVKFSHAIMDIFQFALYPEHLMTNIEQWSYVSPSGQKYISDFYVLNLLKPYGSACDAVIRFVGDGIARLAEYLCKKSGQVVEDLEIHGWKFQVRTKNNEIKSIESGYKASHKDTIEFIVDGSIASSLTLKSMNYALDKIFEMTNKDVMMNKRERIAL